MKYIKNLRETKYGLEGEVYFGLFDKTIGLTLHEGANADFATKCAELLNNLSDSVVTHLCRASELYCNDFLYQVGEPQIEFENDRSVLTRIFPGALIVPPPNDLGIPVVRMELDCEWEEEHGMEWVIRNDRVYYVGGFNGCDPYSEFEGQDSWNYAWQVK